LEGQNVIIIKKVKKVGHGGAHGGSWKVAYADFVTAMMAFFLLLWLISMVAPEKRARVAHYFKHFSMFDKSGNTLLDATRATPVGAFVGEDGFERPGQDSQPASETDGKEEVKPGEQLKQELERVVEQELGDQKDQVLVKAFEGGVRIELVDNDGSPMFPRGRSEMTPEGKKIIKVISENLIPSGSQIALEGHTDAYNYGSRQYSNWELSTERASAARRELEVNGLPQERLLRVAGFAANDPLIKDNPYDPKNRRISIVVFEPRHPVVDAPGQPRAKVASNAADPSTLKEVPKPQMGPVDPVQQYLFSQY
jgi:chemotaxis protein MotB